MQKCFENYLYTQAYLAEGLVASFRIQRPRTIFIAKHKSHGKHQCNTNQQHFLKINKIGQTKYTISGQDFFFLLTAKHLPLKLLKG